MVWSPLTGSDRVTENRRSGVGLVLWPRAIREGLGTSENGIPHAPTASHGYEVGVVCASASPHAADRPEDEPDWSILERERYAVRLEPNLEHPPVGRHCKTDRRHARILPASPAGRAASGQAQGSVYGRGHHGRENALRHFSCCIAKPFQPTAFHWVRFGVDLRLKACKQFGCDIVARPLTHLAAAFGGQALDMRAVEAAGAVSDRCHLQEAVIMQARQRLHVEITREVGHRCTRCGNDLSTMLLRVCDSLKDELLSCRPCAVHPDGRYTQELPLGSS